ncbi:hypothetical protein NM208_g11246 [Fusarium decemcellulare]|uniref:Uncharacterized protein n=1 Tax=Fusarium decemcellulare TaxID=57161 RepID=A0ACC1RV21_9HYPO|nr:hypothetical protein NM208_g11246 [Fusarium decemcellulare]
MMNHLLANFGEWLSHELETGVNGHGQHAKYVPPSRVKSYWTEEKVQEVLQSCDPPLQENAKLIANDYPRIFSILVSISQPQDITLFLRKTIDDHQMPRADLPADWPVGLAQVLEHQWMFCPLEFTYDKIYKRELQAQQILPVTYEEEIRAEGSGPGAARIWKVRIHPECNFLRQGNSPVVFKVYEGSAGQSLYTAEANVYLALSSRSQESITKYYGSFSYEETHTRIIILEYATGGSLLDFLRKVGLPVVPEHFFMLWTRLFELLDGLYLLHNQGSFSRHSIVGVHQDIQLANILVFPRSNKSPYDVTFKLTDFGMAELRRVLKPEDEMPIRSEAAPECYPNYVIQDFFRPQVSSRVDIWALGAVFSDVFVWSIAGESGREEYRCRRKEAIARLLHIEANGFDACFHDGQKRLKAVEEFHTYILQHKRASDPLSSCISQIILEDMLTDHDRRLTAIQTKYRADERIKEIQERFQAGTSNTRRESNPDSQQQQPAQTSNTPQPTGPPPSAIPPPPQTQRRTKGNQEVSSSDQGKITVYDSTVSELPSSQPTDAPIESQPTLNRSTHIQQPNLVSVDRVYGILEKKNNPISIFRNMAMGRLQGKQPEAMDLTGMQEARSKIKERKGRDQIMLIDNFASMETHMPQVAKTARVISYVAKVADDNGMDVYFASDPTRSKKCSCSTAVESAIKVEKTVKGECNMFKCLNDILETVWENGLKPTSIYIYTDGVWESDDDHRVDFLIKQSIQRLVEAKKQPSTLMFQFIQFGQDEKGSKRLQQLDDNYTERHELGHYDIVDTKHCSDHVPYIVIGSISKLIDRRMTTFGVQPTS